MASNSFRRQSVHMLAAGVLGFGIASAALGQIAFTNGGFENATIFGPQTIEGWTNNDDPECQLRTIGDTLTPPGQIRTGQRSIAITGCPPQQFRSWTTDLFTIFPVVGYYDPPFDYNGGDIEVRGWYYIPTNAPIDEQSPAAIKLDIKGAGNGFQNNASLDPWGTATNLITGHTNNQWREYVLTWPRSSWRTEVENNVNLGFFSLPPNPNRVKITIGRFNPNTTGGTGVIFWDDITYTQRPLVVTCGPADVGSQGGETGPDGRLDNNDFAAFITLFFAGNSAADVGRQGGETGSDGAFDNNDFAAFITLFFAGCP